MINFISSDKKKLPENLSQGADRKNKINKLVVINPELQLLL